MATRKIARFKFDILRHTNGDLEGLFHKPKIQPTEKTDYVKLLLLAGEFMTHVKNQLIYMNSDEDQKIRKMTNIIIDDDKWASMERERKLEEERGMADVDRYQQSLPLTWPAETVNKPKSNDL